MPTNKTTGDGQVRKHYGSLTAEALRQRNGKTDEVKGVLAGKGFNNKASYTSKPDVRQTEIQHQVLADNDNLHAYKKEYGIKQNLRD